MCDNFKWIIFRIIHITFYKTSIYYREKLSIYIFVLLSIFQGSNSEIGYNNSIV